ncbi:hypothetical protein WJX72_008909 [[Myrmecia] bisecta]|uniref:Uncharacterized protein n=1 Tax=[Myrmecia] bisecta TaxID=41462 RepID=A0AAW1Q7W9_9CHLO
MRVVTSLVFGALILTSSLASLSRAVESVVATAPVLLWGSYAVFSTGPGGGKSRVSYQTSSSKFVTEDLLGSLLTTRAASTASTGFLNQTSLRDAKPEVLVVFLGGHAQDLTLVAASDKLEPLKAALSSAASSLALPYVVHQEAQGNLAAIVRTFLEAQGLGDRLHMLGSCMPAFSAHDSVIAGVSAALAASSSTAQQVVVVCASPDANAEQGALQVVQEVVQAVQQAGSRAAFLYAAEPSAEGLQGGGTGRALLADLGAPVPGALCTEKCRMQVRVIEVVILAVIFLSALCTGLCCMNMLDTPTKFEAPKESHAQ